MKTGMIWSAYLGDAAGVQDNDLVGSLHRRQPVRDDQHRPPRHQTLDGLRTNGWVLA